MIEQRELERRAGLLGVSLEHAALDYVLNHVLAQIADARTSLVFRGGTALARAYWPDFRISEDLDFISGDSSAHLAGVLEEVGKHVAEATGLELVLAQGLWREDRLRSLVRWSSSWLPSGELLIDVVRYERAALRVEEQTLDLPYSDLETPTRAMATIGVEEILANKWFMLDDRDEPRDLFDLWCGLERQALGFEEIAAAHKARYGYEPLRASIDRADRFESRWQRRLAYQVHDLPGFQEVLATVTGRFDSWERSSA